MKHEVIELSTLESHGEFLTEQMAEKKIAALLEERDGKYFIYRVSKYNFHEAMDVLGKFFDWKHQMEASE